MSELREIPLTRGLVAMVDADDFDWLNQWKWCAGKGARGQFYAVNRDGGKTTLMHRFILSAKPGEIVDHEDRDSLNNTRKNIRIATQAKNCLNSSKRKNSKSRFKGVSAKRNKWEARFRDVRLGVYQTEEDAAHAYDRAALAFDPEFVITNFCADGSERNLNQIPQSFNDRATSSKYIGVSFHSTRGHWQAKFKTKTLGQFKDEISAAKAYAIAANSEVLLCRVS